MCDTSCARSVDAFLQALQAFELEFLRRIVGQVGRRRAGARAGRRERGVEADVVDQLHRLLEILCRFAGEADNEVGGQRQVGPRGA